MSANASSASAPRQGAPLHEILARHRQVVRVFLAGFSATREVLDLAEQSVWSGWADQTRLPAATSDIDVQAVLLESAQRELTHQLNALAQQAIVGKDPLLHLLAQGGLEQLQGRSGFGRGIGAQIQGGLGAITAEERALLHARYKDKLPNRIIARSRGWSTGRVEAQLVLLREALDGSLVDTPSVGKEGIVPTLIEEFLSGTMDAPSRALLAETIMTDLTVAARFERQVRVDLVLTEILSPPSDQDLLTVIEQVTPKVAPQSGAPPVRPANSSRHRTSGDAGDQRKSSPIPVRRSQRRSPAVTWSIVAVLAATISITGMILASASRQQSSPSHPAATRTDGAATSSHQSPHARDPSLPPASAFPGRPDQAAEPLLAQSPRPATVAATPGIVPLAESPTLPERPATPGPPPSSEPVASAPIAASPALAPPVMPVPLAITPPAGQGPGTGPTFVKGIHFGGEAVTIDGHRWLSEKQAIKEGMVIRNGRRILANVAPIPAVDAETKAMFSAGVTAIRNEPLTMSLKLPNGDYDAYVFVMENLRSNSRLLDVEMGGKALAGIGDLPLGGWSKYGPCKVTVKDGTLDIIAKSRTGTPMLMGLALYQSSVSQAYLADFGDGTAKNWAPSDGTWSCADGHYLHTSNQGVEMSLYLGATWSDVRFSASLFPHFDNAYGIVLDALDAQGYLAISITATTATIFRMAHGVKTQIASAPCTGTGQWKWSTIEVTQAGTSLSVSINNAPVFANLAIGEPHVGFIGLFTEWNPVDFAKISVAATGR